MNGKLLASMSIEELENLYKNMSRPTKEQKAAALKKMDTGIYDSQGNLIGDKYWEEDVYAE